MSFEGALRDRLKNAAPVAAIVGTRIDWTVRPEGAPLPAIVLQIVSDARSQHMGGFDAYRATRVQVDCYANTRAAVVTLREAVIAALAPGADQGGVSFLRSFVNNVIDRGENTSTAFVHRDLIDITIWHD